MSLDRPPLKPAPREEVVPDSPQYGLGGRNYAKARKLKQKSDEAKAWQDANTAPVVGGYGIFPHMDNPL